MSNEPTHRSRVLLMLLLWAEQPHDHPPRWRGALETSSGARRYFANLKELNRLLQETVGWTDAPERGAGLAEPQS